MAARRMSRLFAVLLVAGVALENLLPVANGETLADFSIDEETGGGRMMIPRDSRSKRSGERKCFPILNKKMQHKQVGCTTLQLLLPSVFSIIIGKLLLVVGLLLLLLLLVLLFHYKCSILAVIFSNDIYQQLLAII